MPAIESQDVDIYETQLNIALRLASVGIPVLPVRPDLDGPKKGRPHIRKWPNEATTDPDQINAWWDLWPDAAVAVVTGARSGIAVLDLDRKNGKDGVAALEAMGLDPMSLSPVNVETPSGGLHIYFRHRPGLRGDSSGKLGPGIDIKADGGFVFAPGAVKEAGIYRSTGADLVTLLELVGLVGLPEWPEELVPPERPEREPGEGKPTGLPLEVIESALMAYPNDDLEYGDWLAVGAALHHETGGSPEGLDLWLGWSAQSGKHDPDKCERDWDYFHADHAAPVTVWSVITAAERLGWSHSAVTDLRAREKAERAAEVFDVNDVAEPEVAEVNARYALVHQQNKVLVADFGQPEIRFLSVPDLHKLYANDVVQVGSKDRPRYVSKSELWFRSPGRREYRGGVIFNPSPDAPADAYNEWRGWTVEPDPKADCSLILAHVRDVIAAGDKAHADYILNWLAQLVQQPHIKPDVALVLKGGKGCGKDTLAEAVIRIVGRKHVAHITSPEALVGRFNSAFASALLGHVEEAYWPGDKSGQGRLQSLITARTQPIERKGIDTVEVPSFVRLLMTTNERWAIPASHDERRYAVFDVSSHRIGDRSYFRALWRQIDGSGPAAFLHHLLNRDLSGFDPRDAPQTEALMDQKRASLKGVAAWWFDRLHAGTVAGIDGEGWAAGKVRVGKESLREDYEEFTRRRRYEGDPVNAAQFGRELLAMADVEIARPRKGENRAREYVLPALPECRARFDRWLGGHEMGGIGHSHPVQWSTMVQDGPRERFP